MMEPTYRWIEGWEATEREWDEVEAICAARGWASLNRNVTRLRVAEDRRGIIGFLAFHLFPHVGPLHVLPEARGTGIAERLADDVYGFLAEVQVRGFLVVVESPHVARLCEERGMKLLNAPVYIKVPAPEVS
jgi:GNAT superfamily N-acetyltransferase